MTQKEVEEIKGHFDGVAAGLREGMGELAEMGGLGTELRAEMGGLREEMGGLGTELRSEMGGLREEMGGLRAELRAELRSEMGELREEMGGLRTELRAELRSEMGELREEVAPDGAAGGVAVGDGPAARGDGRARTELRAETAEVRRHAGALADDLRSEIRMVADGVALANERVDHLDLRVDGLTGEVRRGFAAVRAKCAASTRPTTSCAGGSRPRSSGAPDETRHPEGLRLAGSTTDARANEGAPRAVGRCPRRTRAGVGPSSSSYSKGGAPHRSSKRR